MLRSLQAMVAIASVVLATVPFGCRPAPQRAQTTVKAPTGEIALSQRLDFADGSQTFQGHGFLARTPSGAVVGVTSAHFLDRSGPKLRRLSMMAGATKPRDVLTATTSLGEPGDEGVVSKTSVDLRTDYLILVPENAVASAAATANVPVLSLDSRPRVPGGERVWLPYSDFVDPKGPELIEGRVVESDVGATLVEFDRSVLLTCESGSPIISQKTGLVIGTLSRGGDVEGKTTLILAPSHAILRAMRMAEGANSTPRLEDGIGK